MIASEALCVILAIPQQLLILGYSLIRSPLQKREMTPYTE